MGSEDVIMKNFPCTRCGCCCENLGLSTLYKDLDDGTGKCIHFDVQTRLCKIYTKRPEKCNVELMYKHFATRISWQEFCNNNLNICKKLKKISEVKNNG